jgi:hypothetical protein
MPRADSTEAYHARRWARSTASQRGGHLRLGIRAKQPSRLLANNRLDQLRTDLVEHVERRQTEAEVRLATELVAALSQLDHRVCKFVARQ